MITEHKVITEPVRWIEVFTGAGRRRTWSAEDKARIVIESLTGEESVCAVTRRHGLSPRQLFGWRRQLRQDAEGGELQAPQFVPAVIEAPAIERPRKRVKSRSRRHGGDTVSIIEAEIDGWFGRGGASSIEGRCMIGPGLVATKPVDFRKGAEGLAALVRETMTADPFSGQTMCSGPSALTGRS